MSTASRPSSRYQFSLHALLMLTLVAAVIVSRVQVVKATWDNHTLAVVAFLFVIGLLHQARDLWTTHRQPTWQSPCDRDGWLFGIGWRVGLSLWILAVLSLDHLEASRAISLPETEDTIYETGRMTREALLRLTLLVAVAGASRHRIPVQAPSIRSRCLDGLGWLGLLAVCFVICLSGSMLPALVHLAIRGIEATRPGLVYGVFRDVDAWTDLTDVTNQFFAKAAVSAALVPLNLALTAVLAWQWRRGPLRRALIAAPLAAGLVVTTGFTVWVARDGFASISPSVAPFLTFEPVYRWVLFGLLIGLASAAIGTQFSYRANAWKQVPQVAWDRHPGTYLHQRAAVLFVLLAICVAHIVGALAIEWWESRVNILSPTELFCWLCFDTTAILELAIASVVIRDFWVNRKRSVGDYSNGPFAVSLPAWATVNFALFLTIGSGLSTLYWFSFAVWLN
jgi:hypothetical protein